MLDGSISLFDFNPTLPLAIFPGTFPFQVALMNYTCVYMIVDIIVVVYFARIAGTSLIGGQVVLNIWAEMWGDALRSYVVM